MKVSRVIKVALIAFFLTVLVFVTAYLGFFRKWNWTINDLILYQTSAELDSDVLIVAIDDKSLADEAMGRWQDWKRSDYADLIEKLEENGAFVIGLDITFSEYSLDKEADRRLAEVLKQYDNIVIGQDSGSNLIVEDFIRDNTSVGIVEFPMETDQQVRKVHLDYPNQPYEHFTIAILRKYLNLTDEVPYLNQEKNRYVLSPHPVRVLGKQSTVSAIPLDQSQRAYINYFGVPNSFEQVSFIDVIRGNVPKEQIEGKIVLVGENASSLYDEKMVPVSQGEPMPGVEIHANFIQTVLEGRFLVPQTTAQQFVSILLTVFAACFLFYFFSAFWTTVLFWFCILVVVWLWAQVAPALGTIVNIFYIFLGLLLSYISIFIYRYITIDKYRQKIEKAFEQYLSKDVVAEIKKHPGLVELKGEKRYMTAFFSDIQGFTTISESLSPEELVKLLNEYFRAMIKILFQYGGTLDKFEGDAIMAFWNAPSNQPDHAEKACLTALKMQQFLGNLRLKWKEEGKPEIKVRMGINSGEMIAGNVGSQERLDYTIMGDAVNLSSRLEGANKNYGTFIMVAESTYQETKEKFEYRELDLLQVKGKKKAVRVYELLARKGHLNEALKKALPHYKAGYEAYFQRKWDYAITHFQKVLDILPEDGPAHVYLVRCQVFKVKPPAEDWDGTFILKSK